MQQEAAPGVPLGVSAPRLAIRTWRFLERESLLVLCTAIFATAFVLRLSGQVNQDAWLAVTGGRHVVEHGLPGLETWTIWGAGKDFVDQQWLAQVGLYIVHALGGWGLTAGFHAAVTLAAIAFVLVVARRRGASQRSVLLLMPLTFFCLITSTWQVRTQTFAYLLFAVTLWLVVDDSRHPSRRVFWCLPLLALWGNLHGSVVLGACLVAIRGLDRVLSGRRGSGLVLAALAPATLLASPYGGSLVGYYHTTLFNPAFSSMLNEWQPPKLGALSWPFFVLALGAVLLVGRSHTALNRYERVVLLVTLAAAFGATRNAAWFAFAALMLCPSALEEVYPMGAATRAGRSRLNAGLAAVVSVVLVALLAATVARPASWFTDLYPPGAAETVARAAARDPQARIFADVRYADWLLWREPQLAGRIAYDARFEVLSSYRIAEIYNFNDAYGNSWRVAARGFRILVLDGAVSSRPIREALREPGARLLYSGHGAAVIERRSR